MKNEKNENAVNSKYLIFILFFDVVVGGGGVIKEEGWFIYREVRFDIKFNFLARQSSNSFVFSWLLVTEIKYSCFIIKFS